MENIFLEWSQGQVEKEKKTWEIWDILKIENVSLYSKYCDGIV